MGINIRSSIESEDQDFVFEQLQPKIPLLSNKKILITGGTGFVGTWILKSLLTFSKASTKAPQIFVLSRNPEKYLISHPEFRHAKNFDFIQGDLLTFTYDEKIDFFIHGAALVPQNLNTHFNNDQIRESIIQGTRNALQVAKKSLAEVFLMLSSGAVYSPKLGSGFTEKDPTCSVQTKETGSYQLSKVIAENLLFDDQDSKSMVKQIARLFTFTGPYFPLDGNYAITEFIKSAIMTKEIHIKGHPNSVRSYMYGTDLVIWLWNMILSNENRALYNIGSAVPLTIGNLARMVSSSCPGTDVFIDSTAYERAITSYYPDTKSIENNLNVSIGYTPQSAVKRSIDWFSERISK